jgi:hypothetical protein
VTLRIPGQRPVGRWVSRAVIDLAAPRRARRRPLARRLHGALPEVAVLSIVNDDSKYARMRESFVAAGFDPSTMFRLSSTGNEPYGAISRIADKPPALYTILCHQDVLAGRGADRERISSALQQLDEIDAAWAVAGTAGVTRKFQLVRALVDPHGGATSDPLPMEVATLDENFLVFNARQPVRTSVGLRGFHLYGSDVGLNARANGNGCWVVDFPLTHLSGGDLASNYADGLKSFIDAWSKRLRFAYVATPVEVVFLGRPQRVFGSQRARWLVGQHLRPSRDFRWRSPIEAEQESCAS